jgi:hypothetical protein
MPSRRLCRGFNPKSNRRLVWQPCLGSGVLLNGSVRDSHGNSHGIVRSAAARRPEKGVKVHTSRLREIVGPNWVYCFFFDAVSSHWPVVRDGSLYSLPRIHTILLILMQCSLPCCSVILLMRANALMVSVSVRSGCCATIPCDQIYKLNSLLSQPNRTFLSNTAWSRNGVTFCI